MAWKTTALVAGAAAVAFVAGRAATWSEPAAVAQPPKETKPAQPPAGDVPPEMAAMMEKMQPGAHHRHLDVMTGRWEGTVKFRMSADEEWQELTGVAEREWDMDGRFLMERVKGPAMMPGMPEFKGLGITGYNTFENRYESLWIENMATYMGFMTGTYDAAKKTLTFSGDMLDPVSGKRQKQRQVIDLSDPKKEVMSGFCIGADGKEFKNFEGTFAKK